MTATTTNLVFSILDDLHDEDGNDDTNKEKAADDNDIGTGLLRKFQIIFSHVSVNIVHPS